MREQRTITAEEVKELVRRYAEQEFPGWATAAVSIRLGALGAHITETLQVLPASPKSGTASS